MKKKSGKRLAAIGIAAAMLTGGLTGCGSNEADAVAKQTANEKESSEGVVKEEAEAVVFPLEENLTLNFTFLECNPTTGDLKDFPMFQSMEKETNITIEWEQIRAQPEDKKQLDLASNSLPDAYFGAGIKDADIQKYKDSFAPLNDLIEKYAPNIKKMFEEFPETKSMCTFSDGTIYSIPSVRPHRPNSTSLIMINKTWLDQLGMEVPASLEELEAVLTAFKEKDPGNVGSANVIPLDFNATNKAMRLEAFSASSFMGSFNINPDQKAMWHVQDGKVELIGRMEEYKTFVKWLNDLYNKGLLDSETFTQDFTGMQARSKDPMGARVGLTLGWSPQDRFNEYADQYITIAPFKSEYTDTPKVLNNIMELKYGLNTFTISADNPHKAETMAWIDKLYENEYSLQEFYGSLGVTVDKEGDRYIVRNAPEGESLDNFRWSNAPADPSPMYFSKELEASIAIPQELQERLDMDAVLEPYRAAMEEVYPPYIKLPAERQEELLVQFEDLRQFRDDKFCQWVVGGNIDEEWDEYLKQFNSMNADELQKAYQAAYDNFFNK